MATAEPSSFVDSAANVIAIFVIVIVPCAGIALFWMVHVLPEKIAEQRHHPQKEAIKVLCLLSLVFGGLLWPFAWLWAYSKPVLHKMAYGTDKHEDYHADAKEEPTVDRESSGGATP
jgi:CBS domain containing-hemolysin-like protein